MSIVWEVLRRVGKTTFEKEMLKLGFWPGAETSHFRLWFSDDDEMIVEEKKEGLT
jgi:hypothetical protein